MLHLLVVYCIMLNLLLFDQYYGVAVNRQEINTVESSADLDLSGFDENDLRDHQV